MKINNNTLNNSTILVCGGAGFIGSNFIHYIFNKYKKIKIINFDKLTYCGNLANLKEISQSANYQLIRGDIADFKKLERTIKNYKPDFIINFAAETHVDQSIHARTPEFITTNIYGVFSLLECIKKNNFIKKFLQVSTDEVYGDLELSSKEKFTENNNLKPNSPYSSSKASGDLLCRAYFRTWGIPVIITRCSNNYGQYQYPEKLIPFFILKMITGEKLPVYGNGRNIRDWVYVLDHCRALDLCLSKGKSGEIYNIGANNERDNLKIAHQILSYFKRDSSWIEFVKDRPGHDQKYAINFSKIKKELGWEPKYNFNKMFPQTIKWYLDNKNWIKNILKKSQNKINPTHNFIYEIHPTHN